MNSLQLTLFESTNAKFRLSINGMFSKKNTQTNTDYPLIRVSQSGNATCAPNVFLVFTYMTDSFETTKSVYTSNPHMVKIRRALGYLLDAVENGSAFIEQNGQLFVDNKYAEPQVIANIGRKNSYVAFRLTADALLDPNGHYLPSLEITLSEAPATCVLTLDEFYAIYEIINQTSLPQMALTMSAIELGTLNTPAPQQRGQNYQAQPRQQYTQRTFQPAQQYYNNQAAPRPVQSQAQNYNNGGGYVPRPAAVQTPAAQNPNLETAAANPFPTQETVTPESFMPKNSGSNQMPPRSTGKSMMKSIDIDSIPTDDLDLGDEGLQDLFSKGN